MVSSASGGVGSREEREDKDLVDFGGEEGSLRSSGTGGAEGGGEVTELSEDGGVGLPRSLPLVGVCAAPPAYA